MTQIKLDFAVFQTCEPINPGVCSPSVRWRCPAVFLIGWTLPVNQFKRSPDQSSGVPRASGGGRPEAATFKSYTLCGAEGTSLTWWESSRTFFSRVYPLFSLRLNARTFHLRSNVSSLVHFLFPPYTFWLSTSSFAIKAEQCCDSQVFQQNTLSSPKEMRSSDANKWPRA